MMTLATIALGLVILAVALWVIAMCLDLVLASSGLPAQIKPIVLAIVGLFGLIFIFRGHLPLP